MPKRLLYLLLPIAFLLTSAFGCPKGGTYHSLVSIEHDFDSSIKALQAAADNEKAAGTIDIGTYKEIEKVVLAASKGGEQINTLLQQNASKQTIYQQATNIGNDLQTLITSGLSGVKNPNTKQGLIILIQQAQAVVTNFENEIGGASAS